MNDNAAAIFSLGSPFRRRTCDERDSVQQRVQSALGRPFAIDMERALVGCSVGAVACDPAARPTTSAEFVKQAEDALSAAKAAGGGRIEVRASA